MAILGAHCGYLGSVTGVCGFLLPTMIGGFCCFGFHCCGDVLIIFLYLFWFSWVGSVTGGCGFLLPTMIGVEGCETRFWSPCSCLLQPPATQILLQTIMHTVLNKADEYQCKKLASLEAMLATLPCDRISSVKCRAAGVAKKFAGIGWLCKINCWNGISVSAIWTAWK